METSAFTPSVAYRDPKAALAWLASAFGFELTMAIDGPPEAPEMCHYEMTGPDGAGRLMIGAEWADWVRSPVGTGHVTQVVHVEVRHDIDAHCERARAAGAVIEMGPEDQFYGARVYRAIDPEGHRWTFSQAVRAVSREEAEAALGVPIMATRWP
jgi:uncharacterized glyoxalase superfamily protein PhnB